MSERLPGQWIEPGKDANAKARSMLEANPNTPVVWIGTKGGDEPRVTVFGRDGRREQMNHTPVMSFTDRLADLVSDWPAGGDSPSQTGDSDDAAAQFILGA